jgi:hypothetical protein
MEDENKYYELIIEDDETEQKELIKALGGFKRYMAMFRTIHRFSQKGLELTMTEELTTEEAMFFTFI